MEIECDLASIRDEDLLRKMWQQSEDFGRKKEIRSHLYKLRESRLREFYSTGGPGGEIMNPATDLHFGKTPLTTSHGDSLADQSFQSLKSKEIRDSLSPTHEVKFRNSGGVAGGVLVPDTTGWNVQTSSEVSPDGRAFRTESLAKTDGVEKLPGGHAEFAGRNEQKSSASHQGDDKNYVKKAAESSKTHLQEKVVIGDENSGRTEMKSSSVTSSSKVVSSSSQQVFSSDDPGFYMQPRRLTNQDQDYQNVIQAANNNSTLHSERQQFSRNERNERQETSSNVREESKKYIDMDKASPEYQQHVQYLMSQPGAIVSNTVEYPKPGVKMITTVKKLPDGTTVKTKRYETEASVAADDSTSISQTTKQQQQRMSSNTTTSSQKSTEKRIQDSEDVFTRLARTRDSNVPASPRNAPASPSHEDVYSRLQNSRANNEQKFSDTIDQRSTQILRDNNQHPGSRNAPVGAVRRPSDLVENVEMISKINKTVKKDQSVRSEKITSSDFIQNERDRYVHDHESPSSRRGPDGFPEALAPIRPSRHGGHIQPQPDDYPSNGYNATEVIKQSSSTKSSAKFSESRRYSTETVESYQNSENENQDYTNRGYPSNRRPIDEPNRQSPSSGRPAPDFSTHGFPSVRSDKPNQQSPSDRPRTQDEYNTTERVHIIQTDRPKPGDVSHSDATTTTRSNYSTNETRRHVTSTNEDFSTHGFPSVRAGTPTRDSPRRPLGSDPTPGDSPRRPSGQEPPSHQARKPPSDGYSTHGFPSVKNGSPTEDSPRRPSGPEPTNQGRRPTTEDFSTHGFPSVKPGRSTPTQSAPHYESSPRVDREDTASVTSDRSNSVIYEKKIDAAHQAFARSLRCASPVESVRRDSTSDRHTPRSSIGSLRNSYSPSKRDGRSPSHDSVTNSETSRISSATVTKTNKPTEVRRVSSPRSPVGKSAPSHVSNETIDLSLTRKITAKPSPDKTSSRPITIKEEPVLVEPILRKKIIGATENFLESESVIEKPIVKNQPYYQLGLSDATLPSSHSKARQHLLGTTPNTSRRPHNTEEEVNTLIDTATKHITTPSHPSSVTPTTRSRNKESKPIQPETIYSKKPVTKPEGYITLNQANEIDEKHNQTTNKHVSYPNYIPSAPKADRSPSDRPTTNNLSSPAPTTTTTTSTTPHNAPKSTKDKVKPSSSTTTSPTTKPLSSPSKVDNSTPSRFTKTVKVENAINRDTTLDKTRRQPQPEPESDLDAETLPQPEDLDEGYVPDRKGKRKPSSRRQTSDDEGFEPESPRAGSPTSDFEYRRPEQEEDSFLRKTNRTDKKVVTDDFLNTERNVTKTRKTQEVPSYQRPRDRDVEKPEGPKRPEQDGRKPSYSVDKPTGSHDRCYPEDHEPKRPSRRPKEDDTDEKTPLPKDRKPSKLVDEPRKSISPNNEPIYPGQDNRRPSYEKEPLRTDEKPTSRPRGTKPPLERSETFEERCRQILGMDSDTVVVVDRNNKTQEFIETERTTVDSNRKPSDRSPSPKKKQPSDTVSIEDCDDDDSDIPRKLSYPGKTREQPRDKSPNKKEPTSRPREANTGDHPSDRSPVGKLPKGTRPNEYEETTNIVTTTKITDDRLTSPTRKSPKGTKPSDEDNIRPRGRSPSERPERVDENTTIRKTSNIIDDIDERSSYSKPGSRPRDQSPKQTQPGEESPRSSSPQGKQPSERPKRVDESTTIRKTSKIVDDIDERSSHSKPGSRPRDQSPKQTRPGEESPRSPSPQRKQPSERPERVDKSTTNRKTSKVVDEIDERSSRSKPGSRPRDQSPKQTRLGEKSPRSSSPQRKHPIDNVSIEDCDDDDDYSDTPRKYSTNKIKTTTTTFETRDHPRDRSPSERGPNRKSPNKERPSDYDDNRPRDRSPSERPRRVDDTTSISKTSKIVDESDKRSTRSKPDSRPRDQSPRETRPREKSPCDDDSGSKKPLSSSTYPRDRSPSEKRTVITTREMTFDVNTPRGKSPSKQLTRETSPTDGSPNEKSPSKKPIHEISPTDKSPRDKSPLKKPIQGSTPTAEYPRDRSPETQKPVRGTSPNYDTPHKSPTRRPVSGISTDDETTITSTNTTTHSNVTDGVIEDRYPSYTPKSYPRDRSPFDKPKSYPQTTDDEEVESITTKKTKKTTEGIHDDVFEVNRPQKRQLDTRDGSFLSQPREQSPSEPASRPRSNETPRDRSPEERTIKETEESINKRTSKITSDTTIESEFTDKQRPKAYPRDRSPNKKPTTEETEEYRTTTKRSRDTVVEKEDTHRTPLSGPQDYPRDRSPVEDLTRPTTKGITTTHRTDKKTVINEFLDTERGVDKPQHPKVNKPTDHRSPERLTSSHPRDYPNKASPTPKGKGPTNRDIDEPTVTKTTKTTRNTTIDNDEVEEHVRPRDRSPTEKPIRSPRIVTTETTTEYGITSRPRSQSPSEKPKKPVDSEDENVTITPDLDTDVKKPSRRPRPKDTIEDQPRGKSPQKPKSSDRSPSPRTKYPKDQGPKPGDSRPQSRSPVGKQPKTTASPRQRSPAEKPRSYHSTDEETNLVKKSKITKQTTMTEDIEDVDFENKPRGRSPSGKPRDSRPTNGDQLPRDYLRGPSPTKKPEDRQPTEIDYEEAIVKRTNKTTKKETTLEETIDRSPRNYPEDDKPRDKSPSSKPRGIRPTEETVVISTTTIEDRHPKSRRGSSPTEKPRPKDYHHDRSPADKPRKPTESTSRITLKETTTIEDSSPKRSRETSPSEKPGTKDYPRNRSPSDKPRKPGMIDETFVERTTIESRTLKDRLPKSPRGTSPTEKSGTRDYPRGRSPTDRSRKPRVNDENVISKTTSESITIKDNLSKSPRRSSPSEKPGPRDYLRDRSPTDKPRKPRPNDEYQPRGSSPTEKPGSRQPRPVGDTVVKRTVKTTTVDDRTTKTPRGQSPTKTSPRERSPTQKPTTIHDRSPKDSPRRTSPSEKPNRRQPIVSQVEKTVQKTTSKFSKDKLTSEKIIVQDHPRRKSPSEKARRHRPTSDDESDDETTETVIAVYTIDGETVKNHPRDLSPSGKPKSIPKQPSEYTPKRPQTNGDSVRPREIHPTDEKPRTHQPNDEETEETFISSTSRLRKERKTIEEIDIEDEIRRNRSAKTTRDEPRETSPSRKPRGRQPTDESIDLTRRTQKGETTLEETEYQFPEDRPRNRSPSDRPSVRSYPRDSSPKKPIGEDIDESVVVKSYKKIPFDDDKSPLQEPQGPRTTEEETVVYTTRITSKIEDQPRDRSPSEKPGTRSYPRDKSPTEKPGTRSYPQDKYPTDKPGTRSYPRDKSPTDKPSTRSYPRDKSPTDKPGTRSYPRDKSPTDKPGAKSPSEKPSRARPSKLEETTTRNTTVRKTVQETDFEKRYPKGRPGDQSPSEKPSTLRRPSKLSATTTTTTTRNRSTLDEQDINKTQRPRTQPSTRDKVPTKTTQLSSPKTQPTTDRRIPAELPSPVRKPKTTFGVTTKTTTVTRLTGPSRPKPNTESPKKPSKLPLESRPSARSSVRKPSPSISRDSSPSRPGSEVEIDSPYRSPNMSPSRNSPSPTRSVKLEDITTTDSNSRKTTVFIDKSKPKVTHVTTAKFEITPPTSPTKLISSPELKYSPSSKKPSSRVPTSKPSATVTTTTKTVTNKTYKEGLIPTDSERDSEVPTDAEEVDTPLVHKPSTRKIPVTERKESAPVHRVTKINKDVQMSRSTSENIIKTPFSKRPVKHEPLETQREVPRPTGDRSSPKTDRRPSKHLSTKTINLTTFDKVINSEDMENVVIDIQHAKSSREPSPNKIVPTPVSIDVYTGKPRYPDVVQEPEDEPKKKPNVKNIPIFEEETNDFVGCQITEVSEETHENTLKSRTTKFIEKESSPRPSPKRQALPKIVTGDNVDSECLLSVHDKVSKFISTAEEVSKPKTSAPFRRDVPEKDMPEDDDECLLTVDEKVSKFLKTADSITKEVITSKPRRMERPSVEDLDEDLKTDECVLSVSEKVNKFTTKAEKLAPTAPQRSPELVARIERQISRQSDVESESPECEDSPVSVRRFKPTSPVTERSEKKYMERQIDILSRPSVWEKKPKPDVKLDDIIGFKPEEEPRRQSPSKTHPEDVKSKPVKATDSVSKRKELFENKVSTNKTTTSTTKKQSSPEKRPSRPAKSPSERHPSDDSDSRYSSEFVPQYVDGYAHQEPDDNVHEDVYGSSRTRHNYEASHRETIQRSTERSPTRKSSHPDNRPTTQTPTKSSRRPEDNTPSRRYSEDHSPRYPTRDQPSTDRYTDTRESSDNTTRRRSSTQEYPERRTPYNGSPHSPLRKQPVEEPEDYSFSSKRDETTTHHTTRTAPRSPKDSSFNPKSFLDDEDHDHSPARSTSTVSSHKQVTTHRSTSKRLTEDITSRRPRRPSGNEPSTPTSGNRTPRGRAVPETVAARRNIFEKSPGDISPMPTNRRPSYMEPTKSSLEHRKDSLEITKTNFSRKSSVEEEPYEPSPKTSVKFGVGLKHKEEPKPKRKLSSSDIPNIEDVFELDLLEEMLNIVTLYEQRRRIRAQIRVVKKLLETKTKEEVSRMTKITTIRKTSTPSVKESPTPKRETPVRSTERYQLTDDDIDSESIVESRHIEEHEEIIRERSVSPKTKSSRIVTKVTEVRKLGEPTTTPNKRTPLKKDEPKDSKPIWTQKNILKKPSDNEKATRALSAKKTTSTSSSSSMSRTQQTHRQRVSTDDDCVTSSYGIGPTDEDGRPLFGIRALKKKTTTNNSTVQPSETTKVTGTVITEKYYSENGAEPVGERKVTVYSTNPEDLVDMETQYDRRDSETVKREKLSKDGVTTVTKVQKIGKYKPGEIPSLTDDAEFTKATSKMVRRGSVKEMSEKFIRKESSSSVTEKSSSGYPKAGLILRTRTNSGATADTADQYEVRAKSTEYDYDSEDEVEIRSSRKHSKVVNESEDETEIRRKISTRSFLNSGGSKVTGVDDVLDRMRNADNVVVDGDTLEDREARSLLNKFLGASVLMSGMESVIPQKELRKTTAGADNKQEVKTTRVTKTIKSGTTGGSSSSPVARETCDFEEIWDEEILKQLLEKSTSYEERRSIRARLRQLMADREACAESKAGAKAELNETKVKTSTIVADDDESSGSEYEEIIEEYTASEDDDEDEETTTNTATTVIAEKQNKPEVKEEKSPKQITDGIKKTTITIKEEPKSVETKKTVKVKTTTTVIEEDASASPSRVDDKKLNAKPKEEDTKVINKDDDDGDSDSVSDSKGESLLIPLLQGLLHKNMPQARSSSGSSSSKTATNSATASNQISNNLKSSLKANITHFSSTSKSNNNNNNNSLGDSGLSSEVSKNSSLGQKQNGSSPRVTAPQQIEDSGTESGEDLRLIAAGIRDSMQIEGIENHSDMSLIKEVTNALNKLESSLKEGKDLALDSSKKSTLLALVERLQTGLTAPDKLSSAVGEQDFPDETSSPEADNHRSNRQRFAKRKNRNNRHTVGVSKEELADARRYMEEMVMIENLSSCTTPESNAATTPPELFAIQKQHSTGAILSSHEPQESSAGLFRPNQFVPNNLKHSTEAGSAHPEVQMRQKKGTPGPSGQRQSTGDMNSIKVPNSEPSNNGNKRPLSDSFDSYTAQNNRVTFSDPKPQNDNSVEEKNQYNRSHHSDDKPNNLGRLSPDSSRLNRFNNKKQLMKRANTIDIPKTHRYNPEFDTDSDFEERSALHTKGLRGTLQVNVKRKPRQVVPNFEPKTENDHKFLAFIQKQNTTTGLGWNSSKSVSNWTNKFGNIKNVFESGANVSSSNRTNNSSSGAPSSSTAKIFWKKSEEQNPPKTSTSVLTSALKAKERNEKRGEVVVPKPIHLNKFSHNPQSAFRPVDTSPETIQMQFKPIPMEKPSNVVVNSLSPTKAYNPTVRRQALESPHYAQSSPTKSWIKKNTATNSPVTLPWTAKPPENNVLKIAATKFESQSPVQRHQSFKQQEKRPSLPNTSYPFQYHDYGHPSQQSYMSNSQTSTSYAPEYPAPPRIFRESSLTNPQAEPLILTSNAPAYSPHSLQPFDYYTSDELNQNVHQTDMTDDDIDDMESMTEYRVEAKVMGKPLSQQAVTVGKRTNHMSDDEVFGKNSRAAKSLLSVMKNIGNGGGSAKPDRTSKKPETKKQPPSACISPNGSAYQAPIVEPLFPDVTKFEANRDPEYIGQQTQQNKQPQPVVGYHQNPVYVPLEEYHQKEPPVAPPRGRKLSQDPKKASAYVPKERPNVYESSPSRSRPDAPSSLPIQAGPTSPPRYLYSSPIKSPESSSSPTAQILNDGMYMQNVPAFRKPYSEPNTPSDYSGSNEAYFNQYGQMHKSYPAPQPPVILPQIPLETSYTKVYDQPRDVAAFYQAPVEHPNSSAYIQSSPKVQPNSQPSMYIPPEYHQQRPEIPQQYYQSPKIQQSPLPQGYAPQQAYQPVRTEVPPEYYQSPRVQQSPQPSVFIPSQQVAAPYQPRVEVPQEYYQSPRTQQISQPQVVNQDLPRAPVAYYQSPQTQPSPQPQTFAPQYADTPAQYDQSPMVPKSPRSDVPPSYYQSPKIQQQQPNYPSQTSEVPLQYAQSPKTPQTKPSTPQQVFKYPQPQQTQQSTTQNYHQSSKTQQSPQPMSPPYRPKAPMIQTKPQVPPKTESVIQSSKSQHSSSSYHQQQVQTQSVVVAPIARPAEQQAPNAAVLCKQASLEGRKRVQSQSQKYEQVEEIRRKSLGNVLEVTRVEREAREQQKAAAIKQDMYSVQQDVYSQQKSSSINKKTEVHHQETKVIYKSSAPDDTPDIVKSSLKKDDIPILKKFGPPQRHCYMPNAYQNPLMKSETTIMNKTPKTVSRKFSDPAVSRGPLIVEIPSTPQPDSQDEIPRNIVFNKINAFTSMSRKQTETATEYTSQQSRPNKLSKCDSWHQICQLQNVPKPPSPRFNTNGNAALRRSKSGHTLAMPKLYEASYDRAQISEKQRTVAAYFSGQKSPNSLSRNSSQTNLADESNYVSVKKSSINRIKTSEKASISRQDPSSGLSRSHTMPQIANVNLLDESNVEDAFEQLMNGLSTTTTEKTETKKEDGGVVTTTTKVTTRTISGAPKPVSPFAKFQQLDKQTSLQSPKSPLTPTTPGGSSSTPIFRFTDPALNARAATFKEQLLQWCQSKTQEYENVQITNFSASWTDGLAFCALIHHFLPDAFDYSKLNPKQRRYNFELAFRVADEKAGIAPLLDVEDMVVMKRPDWKCVFTYVQSIYRRFRNCQ